ncbi:MAG TPA: cation:proton antiporter [Methylomirabilota bacterium]|jgi:Kef-type K+ transport system membrane component KefB|nr:cation:proton antiporter [Methylomirabilota bacterium]
MGHDLLAAIAVSVIAAAALAGVARALRQPLILGYIAGGVVLGRHLGLGVVTDEASIEVISEIGLIFLLFIIGLEIDVPRVLQAGRTILVLGGLQFPLCAALAWYTMRDSAGFGGRLDGLYIAVALSLSSTLIVVKLIFDKLEIATLAGRLTLGVLIFQDLWAIAFMAFQPNLDQLGAGPLLRSLAAGVLLVGGAAVLSRYVLPTLFRAIATSYELVLITAVAWCFLVAGVAGQVGLSIEMGALLAGLVLAAFPYGMEVVARLSGVRDFFVTLFFVTLGLKMPAPSRQTLLLAVAAALVVVASRFAVIFPLSALLRLDVRTATVVSINLSQVSEFSLVILGIGAAYGHVSPTVSAVVLYTLLITAVLSTYGILGNHQIAAALGRAVARTGLPQWMGPRRRAPAAPGRTQDVFLLGCSREGLAFLERLGRARGDMKGRILAIDFNPETLERLQADGVACLYGDIAHPETLRLAGIEHAVVVVSSVPDSYLRGTTNLVLLRMARSLAPRARVIVTADTLAAAETLYSEGAHYVLIAPALAAEHLYELLAKLSDASLEAARRRQALEVFKR